MSLFILDTDHVTLLQYGHAEVVAHVAAIPSGQIAMSIISVDEQLTGWYTQLRKAKDPAKLAQAYDGLLQVTAAIKRFQVLPFTLASAQRYFALRKQFSKLGKMDLAIAATALEENGTVVTRNWGHYQQVPGLVLADWS